jgi:hypothetical protein
MCLVAQAHIAMSTMESSSELYITEHQSTLYYIPGIPAYRHMYNYGIASNLSMQTQGQVNIQFLWISSQMNFLDTAARNFQGIVACTGFYLSLLYYYLNLVTKVFFTMCAHGFQNTRHVHYRDRPYGYVYTRKQKKTFFISLCFAT